MGDDEVDHTVAWLLTVPAVAALRPRYCGATIRAAGWCGEGARGPAAPSGVATWSTRPGGGTHAAIAPMMGAAGCPGPSAIAAAVPFGRAEMHTRDDLSAHNSWGVAAGMFMVLSFSGASCSRFGCGGNCDGTAYVSHVPRGVHIPAHPRSPHVISACMRGGLRGGWVSCSAGLLLGLHG